MIPEFLVNRSSGKDYEVIGFRREWLSVEAAVDGGLYPEQPAGEEMFPCVSEEVQSVFEVEEAEERVEGAYDDAEDLSDESGSKG